MTLTIELALDLEIHAQQQAQIHGYDVSTYISKLIERDHFQHSFETLVAPFRQAVAESDVSDDDLDQLFTQARRDVYRSKQSRRDDE